jgi:hypothetical protein
LALCSAQSVRSKRSIGAWQAGRQNVFAGSDEAEKVKSKLTGIAERADRPHFRLVNADAMVHTLGSSGARSVRYHQEAPLLGEDDMLVHLQNPDVVPDEMAALYTDAAEQVLHTRLTDAGLQYLTLRKSPCGFVGSTSLVEYATEPPYVEVQYPPRKRENPMAE